MAKPGYKTSEGWLTLLAEVVGAMLATGFLGTGSSLEQMLGIGAMVLAAMGYTASRTIVKRNGGTPNAPNNP